MAARAGSEARIDLGRGSDSEVPGIGLGKPGVVVPGILVGPFPFAVASLGAKSSFCSIETAELL